MADSVHFSVNKPIKLLRIQHFGSDGGEHTVSTEVKDTVTSLTVVKRSGTFKSEKDANDIYYGFFLFYLIILSAWRQMSSIS